MGKMSHRHEVPLIERMIDTQIEKLMSAITNRPEYSEAEDRDNHLAEINACLLGLRYAIEKNELPGLTVKILEFLDSVNTHRN